MLDHGSYHYIPGLAHDKLAPLLKDSHFYIFPSTQPREGQSNSVTECMSFGIIPIASPQGFNRSTIGDDYLIIDELKYEKYAGKILEIIDSQKLQYYSKQIYDRFCNNFIQSKVFKKTIEVYEEIFVLLLK